MQGRTDQESSGRECACCQRSFERHADIREHHCRHCNRLVCSDCSKSRMAIPKLKTTKAVRVCDTCLESLESEKRLINLVNQQRRAGQVPKAEQKKMRGVGKLQLKKPSELRKDGESPAVRLNTSFPDPETGWTSSGKFKVNGELLIDSQKVSRIELGRMIQAGVPSGGRKTASPAVPPLPAAPVSPSPEPDPLPEPLEADLPKQHNPLKKSDFVDEGPIGRGGSGVVRLLRHTPSDIRYACKIIILSPEVDERVVSREVEAMDECWHNNLVHAITAFLDRRKRALHVIQEYMDGGSLEDILKTPGVAFTENIVAAVAKQCCAGLQFLHDKTGMKDAKVHRDLKPANILASTTGLLKIADFGITAAAKTFGNSTFVGTSIYMAPERIKGEKYGIESDIWSLGLTLVELLTGKCPFAAKGPNFLELFVEITNCKTLPLPPSLSPECQEFINLCVRHEAADRGTVEDLLKHKFLDLAADQEEVAEWVEKAVSLRRGTNVMGCVLTGKGTLAPPPTPAADQDDEDTNEGKADGIPSLRGSPPFMHKTKKVFNRLTGRTMDCSPGAAPVPVSVPGAVEAFT